MYSYYSPKIFNSIIQLWNLLSCLFIGLLYEFRYKLLEEREYFELDEDNVEGEVVVITGANRGLGKATALEFAKRQAIVILGCRDLARGRQAVNEIAEKTGNNNLELLQLDLEDFGSVRKFADAVSAKYPKIKILVNNADVNGKHNGNKKCKQNLNAHVVSNYLGHFLLTNLLTENLKQNGLARVISLSANCLLCAKVNLQDLMMENQPKGVENTLLYSNTKFMVSLFIRELGKRLRGSGVTTYSLCPGMVDTPIHYQSLPVKIIFKFIGFTVEQSAREFIIPCALSKKLEQETGLMYHFRKPYYLANERLNDGMAAKLWDYSYGLINENNIK